mgnify:CR=1 FL=1
MSTIETTQSSFLLRYGALLIVFTELLMICTVIVLYLTGGAYIPTLVMLFLSPLLGSAITVRRLKKYKKVLFKESLNKYFTIISIILYIGIYLFNFRLNVILLVIYGIGAVIGFLRTKKAIEKMKTNMETGKSDDERFFEGKKIEVKEFDLRKFNGESIREFLKINQLEEKNYLLAQIIPTVKEYLLYGYFSLSSYIQYIVYFDDKKLYFFELSKLRNTSIKNGFFVKFEDLQIKKLKKGLLAYKIYIEFKDGSKVNMQIPKKVVRMYMQKQYSEKLFNKFSELKNKE